MKLILSILTSLGLGPIDATLRLGSSENPVAYSWPPEILAEEGSKAGLYGH